MARPSTGSWDGLAGIQLRHWVGTRTLQGEVIPVALSAGVLARGSGEGTDGYRMGSELALNLGGGWALTSQVRLLGQINTRWRAKDDSGDAHLDEEEDNTGGTAMFATPGLRIGIGPAAVYGYMQIRVFERVNGIQITAPYHLAFGTSYGF
jgi:hypothetical protein